VARRSPWDRRGYDCLIRRSARGVSSRMPRSVSRGKRAPQVPDRLALSGHVAVSAAVSLARDCFVSNPGRVTA
jgi:hypothetical protein